MRVINKFTAKRTLLKGHKQRILDLRFMETKNNTENVLASSSLDGSLIIWDIFENDNTKEGIGNNFYYFFFLS